MVQRRLIPSPTHKKRKQPSNCYFASNRYTSSRSSPGPLLLSRWTDFSHSSRHRGEAVCHIGGRTLAVSTTCALHTADVCQNVLPTLIFCFPVAADCSKYSQPVDRQVAAAVRRNGSAGKVIVYSQSQTRHYANPVVRESLVTQQTPFDGSCFSFWVSRPPPSIQPTHLLRQLDSIRSG